MRTLRTRVLLASVLAIGAQLAGCGDVADCPSGATQYAVCSTKGLTCFAGSDSCTCNGSQWRCNSQDLQVQMHGPQDMSYRHDDR